MPILTSSSKASYACILRYEKKEACPNLHTQISVLGKHEGAGDVHKCNTYISEAAMK